MIVVADTSPLNYLILIGHADILRTLFQRIIIPHAVNEELLSAQAPVTVASWMANPPAWLEVRPQRQVLSQVDPRLDAGEREAISLALELHSSALVIDEIRGRREAMRHGLTVVGTLGILERAHDLNLLDLRTALGKLQQTSFYLAPSLIENSLQHRY